MVRRIYLTSSVVLGVLASFIVHGLVEQLYISLLVQNFTRWSFGLRWESLLVLHHAFSLVLLVVGVLAGYRLGIHWWQYVYVKLKRGLFLTTVSS